MLNKLWGFMILIGILFAAATGKIGEIGTAALDSSKEAVTLCITMLGIMSMWTGLMNIAKKAGIIDALTKALRPVLAFLFPGVPKEHKANEYMAANMISNVLGLGWAATPVGLKAMEELKKIPHVHVIGSQDPKEHNGILNFTVDGVHPHDIASILDGAHVDVRAGHHCAQPLLAHLGVMVTTRASISFYNSEEDVLRLIEQVKNIRRLMGYDE